MYNIYHSLLITMLCVTRRNSHIILFLLFLYVRTSFSFFPSLFSCRLCPFCSSPFFFLLLKTTLSLNEISRNYVAKRYSKQFSFSQEILNTPIVRPISQNSTCIFFHGQYIYTDCFGRFCFSFLADVDFFLLTRNFVNEVTTYKNTITLAQRPEQ